MTGTMTWVGLDVHARSTHAAAIDTRTGELTRMRFGPGVEAPVAWLGELGGPVRACDEAGPTGFGPAGSVCTAPRARRGSRWRWSRRARRRAARRSG